LWRNFPLKLTSENRDDLEHLVKIKRFSQLVFKIYGIDSLNSTDISHLYQSEIKHLDISNLIFLGVSPTMKLAEFVNNLTSLVLKNTEISKSQYDEIFTLMKSKSLLKKLSISDMNLNKVEPLKWAQGLNNLEDVTLMNVRLIHKPDQKTRKHIVLLFEEMSRETKLKKFKFSGNMQGVNDEVLGKCVNKLEHVNLNHTPPYDAFKNEEPPQHLLKIPASPIFHQMKLSSNLSSLSMSDFDLTKVEPGTLSSCLNKLEDIYFSCCIFSENLGDEVFQEMAVATRLKRVRFFGHQIGVGKTSPELLSKCMNKMQEVCIQNGVTQEQGVEILKQCSIKTSLRKLEMCAYYPMKIQEKSKYRKQEKQIRIKKPWIQLSVRMGVPFATSAGCR